MFFPFKFLYSSFSFCPQMASFSFFLHPPPFITYYFYLYKYITYWLIIYMHAYIHIYVCTWTFWQYLGLNSGLHYCKSGALLFESSASPFYVEYFSNKVLIFAQSGLDGEPSTFSSHTSKSDQHALQLSQISAYQVARITGLSHCTSLPLLFLTRSFLLLLEMYLSFCIFLLYFYFNFVLILLQLVFYSLVLLSSDGC
jgi:hypothetical protein